MSFMNSSPKLNTPKHNKPNPETEAKVENGKRAKVNNLM